MPTPILKLQRFFLDLLFPIRCLGGCGRFDTWLCEACQKKIGPPPAPECPICRTLNHTNCVCSDCRKKSALDGLIVRADYQNQLVQDLVKTLKYHYASDIGHFLGNELAKTSLTYLRLHRLTDKNIFVTPIPLHWQRKNERGFNQAEEIARWFSDNLDLTLKTDILSRICYTAAQARLSRTERLENLQGTFRIKPGVVLSRQTVIIIDDVATTTATLEVGAQTLKNSGAKEVWGIVFARSKNT